MRGLPSCVLATGPVLGRKGPPSPLHYKRSPSCPSSHRAASLRITPPRAFPPATRPPQPGSSATAGNKSFPAPAPPDGAMSLYTRQSGTHPTYRFRAVTGSGGRSRGGQRLSFQSFLSREACEGLPGRGGCPSLAWGREPLARPKGPRETGVSRFLRTSTQMGPSPVSKSHSSPVRVLA